MNKNKFAALIAAIIVVAALLGACASGGSSGDGGSSRGSGSAGRIFLSSVSWDAEYDVIVVGFGGAGATAAVTAADAEAKVLLLEKAPEGEEGGNTRYAMQAVLTPKKREESIRYYKGLRGLYDHQTDEEIEFIVDGHMENIPWFKKMGVDMSKLTTEPNVEYPELDGGKDNMEIAFVDGVMFQSGLYKFLHSLVDDRKDRIDVWYGSPAVKLIQDKEAGIVHGVVVENSGKRYNVRAENGVILATGGFENSDEMLENYAQLADAYAMGARFNTGDGIKMAMDIGADLWHMSSLSGPYLDFINPDSGNSQGVVFSAPVKLEFTTGFGAYNMIVVGGNGRRFTNEVDTGRHGHINVGGTYFSRLIPKNSWCIFDETARKAAPAYMQWSQGMVDELAKGWVLKGNTVEELAAKLNINPAALAAEVAKFNGYCKAGSDPEFGLPAPFLKPLETGPYYAFPVKAALINTQGGPRRNVKCEVLDVWGKPIPHLYSAGELGSFYADIYQGAGNLSECLFTGRESGKNAAALKNDVPQSGVLVKKTSVDFRSKSTTISTGPGEYLGIGSGMGGELIVKVKLEGSRIASVAVVKQNETTGISDRALEVLPGSIVKAQNTKVDTVTGATVTSKAIIQAVNDALNKAK
jgi:succinate dehydrogenase/fumarate reductase flavoprotein subunit/uncharacterized protein with FMN-binding domain